LHLLIGSITRVRAKRIKEAFNGLIQYVYAKQALKITFKVDASMKLSLNEDEALIKVIQAKDRTI
jgi:hypothetical protein